jgi:hypothetical protein
VALTNLTTPFEGLDLFVPHAQIGDAGVDQHQRFTRASGFVVQG